MKASRLGLKEINVHFGTFDFSFICLIGPYDNVEKFVRWKVEDETSPFFSAPPRGGYFYRPGYVPILWIPRKPRTPREYGTLAHECLHMVVRLMAWADIQLSPESEEAFTHAIGFAVTQILEGASK
jgi:hypothetical protein